MTPARLAREMAHIEAMNDKLQQEKFIEFKSACDNGEPGGCNGLGEWYAVRGREGQQARHHVIHYCMSICVCALNS